MLFQDKNNSSSTESHRQLRVEDEASFKQIYDLHKADLYGYCRSLVKSDAYAEEVVQDVFVKFWVHFERIDQELSIRSYLFTMVRNASFNFLKKAARTKELHAEIFRNEHTEEDIAGRSLLEADYDSIKEKAIDLLPPKRKAIFLMSRNDDMSYADIGKELNISVSTVKTQMSLALATIREYLKLNTDLTFAILWLLST